MWQDGRNPWLICLSSPWRHSSVFKNLPAEHPVQRSRWNGLMNELGLGDGTHKAPLQLQSVIGILIETLSFLLSTAVTSNNTFCASDSNGVQNKSRVCPASTSWVLRVEWLTPMACVRDIFTILAPMPGVAVILILLSTSRTASRIGTDRVRIGGVRAVEHKKAHQIQKTRQVGV